MEPWKSVIKLRSWGAGNFDMMNSSLHKPYYDFFHFWKKKIICQMKDVKITSITSQKTLAKRL